MRQTILKEIAKATSIEFKDIQEEDTFDVYGIDSLDFANLVIDFEAKYNITFTEDEIDKMRFYRIGQLVDFLEKKIKND